MSNRFEQLKNKYRATFSQKLLDLKEAKENEKFDEIHGLLHKLAGSSGSYGFTELSLLCREGMNCIDEGGNLNQSKQLEQNLEAIFVYLQAKAL